MTGHKRSRAGLLLAALVVTIAALSGCGSGPTAAPVAHQSPAPPAPTPPPTPACYQLTYQAAVAPTNADPAVECGKPHTTETVSVGAIDAVADGHLLAVDSELVQAQVATACPRALTAYVGGNVKNLRLSMIRPVWFTPTVKQSDHGAAWYRCDAVVLSGNQTLEQLSRSLKGTLAKSTPKDLAMCGTAAPDEPKFVRVLCSAKHSWRAIDVVTFKQDSYPGEKVARKAGRAQCEEAAANRAKDPFEFEWGYEWPTESQWKDGQKFGRCWARG